MSDAKCILIDPAIIAVNISKQEGIKELTERTSRYPPIGLTYLAAILRGNGVEVKIIDAKSLNIPPEQVAEAVQEEKPDIVGVTIFSTQLRSALQICQGIKELCPSTIIVVGGPHVNPQHEELIEEESIDFCVRGEGEITLMELVNAISNGDDLEKVKGITFKKGDEIIVTPDRPFLQDLDTLPFPARDLLPDIYKGAIGSELDQLMNFTLVTATRGCPFRCHFCTAPKFSPIHRRRSVANVLDELEQMSEVHKISYFRFTDDIFIVNRKWVSQFCRGFVDRGLNDKISWSCDARVDNVSEEILKEMKEANCSMLAYGIEFGNQRILDFCGKGTRIPQIHEAIELTKKVGIRAHGLFMFGYPTETKETMEDTIALAKSLKVDSADFFIVTPFPGSQLYEYCKENDLLRTENWEEYNYQHPEKGIIKLDGVTDEELISLYERASKEFYFRHVSDRVREEFTRMFD